LRSDDEMEGVPRGIFKLDPVDLLTNIFLSPGQLDQVYNNLFVFRFKE